MKTNLGNMAVVARMVKAIEVQKAAYEKCGVSNPQIDELIKTMNSITEKLRNVVNSMGNTAKSDASVASEFE